MTRQQPAYLCAGERAGSVPVCAGVCQCAGERAGSVPVCASVPGACRCVPVCRERASVCRERASVCQCVPGLRQGCACDACPALHLIGRLS